MAERVTIPSIKVALTKETVDSLKELAHLVSTDKKPARKAELIDFIHAYLKDDKLRNLWERLDTLQQAAVAETVHGPDTFHHSEQFRAKYQATPYWGERDSIFGFRRTPSLLALFFYGSGIMPNDLKQALQAFVPKPKTIELPSQDEIPTTWEQQWEVWNAQTKQREIERDQIPIIRCETARAASHDLQAVLQWINAGKLAVSDKTRYPSAAAMKAMLPLFIDGDFYDDEVVKADYQKWEDYYDAIGPIKPFAWTLLVQAAGLAELSGKRLQLTKNGKKALSNSPEHTIATLWKRWLKTTLLDELRRIDCIKGQNGKGKRGLTAVADRRQVINQALMMCPPHQWIDIDEWFRYMQATGMEFDVTRDPWQLYIADPHYGSLGYEGFGGWNILPVRYTLCLLFEYAATLGLIDIAYVPPHGARTDFHDIWGTDDMDFFSRYDGLLFFRLNALGAYCLGIESHYTPTPLEIKPVLKVLPNLEIVTIGEPLKPADTFLLNNYAESVSDAVWRLTQNKLLIALEKGFNIADLQEFLQARSGGVLPETVTHLLTDIAHRTTQLQDKGTSRLIECADAALATLIAHDARTKPYCLLAGDRYLVVATESETRFRNALRQLGYTLPQ